MTDRKDPRDLLLAAQRIQNIPAGLVTLARLKLLEMICEPRLSEKAVHSSRATQLAEVACWTLDLIDRYLHRKYSPASWPRETEALQGFEHNGKIDVRLVRNCSDAIESQIRYSVLALSQHTGIESGLTTLIPDLIFSVLPASGPASQTLWTFPTHSQGIVRALHGPKSTVFDPVFEATYSVLEQPPPRFSESLSEIVPFFWTLALREANAADICALSAVEFDGLPYEFYRDLAKQSWDEARHAEMFLRLAVELLPEIETKPQCDHAFCEGIETFRQTGRGLPVPREGGLYEAIWNATLEERLILMQIRTEGPAVAKAKQRQNHPICRQYPGIAHAYQVDEIDEISHAAIGWRWLKHLCPDEASRTEMCEQTDLLRGFLLATSIATRGSQSVADACDSLLSGTGSPASQTPA